MSDAAIAGEAPRCMKPGCTRPATKIIDRGRRDPQTGEPKVLRLCQWHHDDQPEAGAAVDA